MSDLLLDIDGLKTYFHVEGRVTRAVDGVSFSIRPGETLGVVGESGSGKSVTALSTMGLLPKEGARIHAGRIAFLGRDLVGLPNSEMCKIRGSDISMIFQEPMTSLNPM
ncbi:MAG: ATP-binding cassette domain-containing protein, partial [Planctomycetota bacterium]|nr:ATP-binding cassette domain-containing protein [Planctomycetota bacterium]